MTVAIAERLHRRASGGKKPDRKDSDWAFLGASAVLFTASATATILWCIDMPAICGMSMPGMSIPGMSIPGGWTMSMAWMRMPGQSWPGAAISFLTMWTVMMVAMMLPSLMPMLWRYRRAIGVTATGPLSELRLGLLVVSAALGYFTVWTAIGLAVYLPGVALAAAAMDLPVVSRAVPLGAGAVVLAAGLSQLTAWKARRLAGCRAMPICEVVPGCCAAEQDRTQRAEPAAAWLYGLRLGLHCTTCCAGPMAVLLVLGVMDLGAMAVVTVAITLERLAPAGVQVARITGVLAVAAGALLIAQALGLA